MTTEGRQHPEHAIVPLTDAEEAVIGGILHDGGGIAALDEVCDLGLEPRDFADRRRMLAFDACLRAAERGELDITIVASEARIAGYGDVADLIADLYVRTPSAANIRYHAEIVLEHSRKRRLAQVGQTIAQRVAENGVGSAALLEEAERMLLSIDGATAREEATSVTIASVLEDLHRPDRGGIVGVPTGFYELDEHTLGFRPGELIVAGGRPGMGKSTFATNAALHAASKGHTAVLFSLEMPRKMILLAALSATSGVDFKRLQRAVLATEEHARVADAASRLDSLADRFHIVECAGIQPHHLVARMRRWRRKGADVFFVDHAQMMVSGDKLREEVTHISRAMKHAALNLETPVVLLSQLSRAVESRRPPRPRMSDLRESGSIEQDADQVLLFYREHYYHPSPENEHFGEVIVAKGRYVGNETVVLGWRGENARWENPTPEAVAEYQTRDRIGRGGRPEDTGLRMEILRALAGGIPMAAKDLADTVSRNLGRDIVDRTLRRWCRRLEEEGRIERDQKGVYRATEGAS